MEEKEKVIIITGASKGIGKVAAIALAKQGHRVYATMRDPSKAQFSGYPIQALPLDVAEKGSTDAAISQVIKQERKVDVLINNAGYGLFGPVELATEEEILLQFNVNVFGMIRATQSVLPQMRYQKEGMIINISSVAGFISNAGIGCYAATKHAVEAISGSLAMTLFPWNIKVVVVEPGPVATDFVGNMSLMSGLYEENPYKNFVQRYQEHLTKKLGQGQPPEEIGNLIAQIISEKNPHFRYQTNKETEQIATHFLVDPTGDQFIQEQQKLFKDWF